MQSIIPIPELIFMLDMMAAVAFAVSGALVASRKGLDVVGFMWLAFITGVGGGTLRDLILGVPVFWIVDTAHIYACFATAVVMFFIAPMVESRKRLVLWYDAIGLAFVTVVGTVKGLEAGTGPLIAVVMGVMTATVGGIIRDVVSGEPSVIMKREIYVTAAVAGGAAFVVVSSFQFPNTIAAISGFLTTFLVRGCTIIYNWSLPSHGKR